MLKTKLLHPDILRVLGSSGHGSRILVADGNFPYATGAPVSAERVYLNLMAGIPKVTDVIEALVATIPIESADVMVAPDDLAQIHVEFQNILPKGIKITVHNKADFYAAVRTPDTVLVIATGEQRRFANILITVGVVKIDTTKVEKSFEINERVEKQWGKTYSISVAK